MISISSIAEIATIKIGTTFLWWSIYACTIYIIINLLIVLRNSQIFIINQFKPISLLLVWYIICIIRGCIVAEGYWQWKNLTSTSFVMLLTMVAYIAASPIVISDILSKWLKWAFPLFFLLYPFIYQADGVGKYLVPISFLMLFWPLLNLKWKLIVLFGSLIVILGNLDARSNVIKFVVPVILTIALYLGIYKSRVLLNRIRVLVFFLPFMLLILGTTGVFNIFRLEDYTDNEYINDITNANKAKGIDLKADTRTFLYEEVISSSIKHDYYIFGRTPARGNESEAFGWGSKSLLKLKTNERYGNEVSILNIFNFTGLIGVILYFIVFYQASYLSIVKSKNTYSVVLGCFITFRWFYAWVEDFTNFDLSYFFLWIMIGLCYSRAFRNMNDTQIKYWVRSIFDIEYRKKLSVYNKQLVEMEHIANI